MGLIRDCINNIADELGLLKQEEVQLHERLREIREEKDLAKATIIKFGGTLTGEFFTAMVRPRHSKHVDTTLLKNWVMMNYPDVLTVKAIETPDDHD